MASCTLDKIIRFFEGGQNAILEETVVDEPEEPDAELDAGLGNWDDLRDKIDSGEMERFLEVGIGTTVSADDSEWFRLAKHVQLGFGL